MKTFYGLLLGLFLSITLKAQVISEIEYFFDNDPGVGEATPIDFTSYTQVDQTFTADISTLTKGLHRLFIRAKDSTGRWSLLSSRIFNLTETENIITATEIKYAEYFIDTDPGIGNGTPVDFAASEDLSITINNDLTGLSNGLHRVFIRSQDNTGKWSLLGSRLFNISDNNSVYASTINSLRWTISGNNITPFSESKTITIPLSDISENITPDLSGLTTGNYTINLTAIDNSGSSSAPFISTFALNAPPQNKNAALFDGNGDRIRVTDAAILNPNANNNAYKVAGNNLTIEAWVFLTGVPLVNSEFVIAARGGANSFGVDPYYSYALRVDNNDGNPRFNFFLSTETAGQFFGVTADSINVETGKWYHIAGTYDGTSSKIYINGQVKNETASGGKQIGAGAIGFYIGGTVGSYFKGLIDDVRLWNITRTSQELSSSYLTTLNGSESGLSGYWSLDSTYVSGANVLTPDATSNKNDLAIQFDAKLIANPAGSEVLIDPKNITLTNSYGLSGINLSGYFLSDGWPQSAYTIVEAPTGFQKEGNLYSWTPGATSYGNFRIILTANNGGTSLTDTVYIYVDNFVDAANGINLTVNNRGKIGAYGNNEKGLSVGGKNGLYSGDFSLVDAKNSKYAGGLFSTLNSFRPLTHFQTVQSSLSGFTALQSEMDDGWESNGRINVKVLQTVYTKSTDPDKEYSLVEYKIINTSGELLDSIYAQFTADFDFPTPAQSGFDYGKYLTYSYEKSKANNPNYYGFSIVNQAVSGSNIFLNGADPQYVRNKTNLKNFTALPIADGDHRNQLNAGPFTIANGDTLTVVYAFSAASTLKLLEDAVIEAKNTYRKNTAKNENSLFVDGAGDRVRVLDGSPVNPTADQNAYKNYTDGVTFEADVFATAYPPINTFDEILIRPGAYLLGSYNNGSQSKFMVRIYDTNNGWVDAFATAPYSLGEWYHLSATFDGTSLKLYVNGNLQETQPFTNTPNPGQTGFYIGRYVGTNTGFNGLIDNVRLWSYPMGPDDINGNMNLKLLGTEAGLSGFWPFEEFYSTDGNTVTPDMTGNKNDLIVQFDSKLLPFPYGSNVQIKPTTISVSNLNVPNNTEYSASLTSDGWPAATFAANSLPPGMTLNNGILSWTTPENAFGIYYLDIKATNSAGSIDFINNLFVENIQRVQNLTTLDVAARGKLGFFVNPNRGLFFGGVNGLAGGDFSLVDKNNAKYAGGLYSGQNSFRPTGAFSSVEGKLLGFSAYRSTMDDLWESNRIGVKVVQTVYTKNTDPDRHYTIIEYQIINTSGNAIDDLYPQFTADFDIGNSSNNLGGFEVNHQVSYSYEKDAANPKYYGFQLINKTASGYNMFLNGADPNYVRNTSKLDEKGTLYSIVGDYRNQINTGPFNMAVNETLTVAYSFMAGNSLESLVQSAIAAKSAYNYAGNPANTAAAYFNFTGDRFRTQTGYVPNPNANLNALTNYANGMTVEAWVFIEELPKPNNEQIIVSRPVSAGNPFQIYSLRFANFNQQNTPTLEFIISDGVTKDNWGNAGITVDPSYIGKWIHVAGTYDNNMVKLYVDGNQVASGGYNKLLGTNGVGIYIGGGTSYGYLKGVIDEVRFWNHARNSEEIKSLMNYSLTGTEQGLNGYWPLNTAYQTMLNNASVKVTPDLSPNKNDVAANGLVRLVESVAGSQVAIAPRYLRTSDNYLMTGVPYKQRLIADGWPKPTVQLNNPLSGMTIAGDSLSALVNEQFWGEYYLKSTLSNNAGSANDSTFMFVALTKQIGTNQQNVTFATQGSFGTRGRNDLGLKYKGKNGLFAGNLGIISKLENKLSGGLYNQPEFSYDQGIKTSNRSIPNFGSAHVLKYDDKYFRNANPIGVEITQTVMQKNSAPDDKYSIVEFSVKNISGKDLTKIYVQMVSDFDIGNALSNMGGYDAGRQLSYAFEPGGANNSYYYGMSLLDEKVSGHMVTYSGTLGDDKFGIAATDSMAANPVDPTDVRNSLFAGPFNIPNGDSVVVSFAYLTGDNLTDIQLSADAAKLAYSSIATNVEELPDKPLEFVLEQNYPNPFNPSTRIDFRIGTQSQVKVEIYDLLGRKVAALVNDNLNAGLHHAYWNGKNQNGEAVASGIYIYRMTAVSNSDGAKYEQTRKMVMLK